MNEIQLGNSKVSTEEFNLLATGTRPDGMDYDKFKELRALTKKYIKKYLQGQYYFISSALVPTENKKYVRQTATYVKPKEK